MRVGAPACSVFLTLTLLDSYANQHNPNPDPDLVDTLGSAGRIWPSSPICMEQDFSQNFTFSGKFQHWRSFMNEGQRVPRTDVFSSIGNHQREANTSDKTKRKMASRLQFFKIKSKNSTRETARSWSNKYFVTGVCYTGLNESPEWKKVIGVRERVWVHDSSPSARLG